MLNQSAQMDVQAASRKLRVLNPMAALGTRSVIVSILRQRAKDYLRQNVPVIGPTAVSGPPTTWFVTAKTPVATARGAHGPTKARDVRIVPVPSVVELSNNA